MRISNRFSELFLFAVFITLQAFAPTAQAQTATGSIDSKILLVDGCVVENSTAASGVDFGSLDFGSKSTLFTSADAEVTGVNGNGISIVCSAGNDAIVKVVNGANDANGAGHTHAMAFSAKYVPYDLYSAAGRAAGDRVNNNDAINVTGDGTTKTIRLYARAVGASGLSAGLYQDTLTMQIDF